MTVELDQGFVQAFINGAFGLPIAHENAEYEPDGTAYAELLTLDNDVTAYSLKDSDETDGAFRVLLRFPSKGGAIPHKQTTDAIMDAFKIGTQVCYGGKCATIVSQRRQAGVSEGDWYKIVLTFRYRAILRRN